MCEACVCVFIYTVSVCVYVIFGGRGRRRVWAEGVGEASGKA